MKKMYETERFILCPFDREIASNSDYEKWMYDKDVTAFNHWGLFPHGKAKEEAFLDMCESGDSDIVLAIMVKENKTILPRTHRKVNDNSDVNYKHIGNLSLQRINWIYRSSEYAITIGDKEYWNKGIGYEASLLLFYHGFSRMNLHRIWTATAKTNDGMKRLVSKLDMFSEGYLKEAMFLDGKYVDIIQFAILENEWRENQCQKAKRIML